MAEYKGFLTDTDKEFLRGEREYTGENAKQMRYQRRRSIRERTRGAFRDFALLAEHLPKQELDKIFTTASRIEEQQELHDDLIKAIKFIYVGLGGESAFRSPLKWGVAEGEVALGNIDFALDIDPTFAVDVAHGADARTAAELVEAEEWDRLDTPSLATFVKTAVTADAIDFDEIHTDIDLHEWMEEYGKYSTSRVIPDGKSTPRMERDVYESEGIGDMTGEELHELFGEGHHRGAAFYDGEAVYKLPKPWSDADPELLYYIDK